MKIVAVAGGWDPLHIGHIRHIQKASELGDQLVVIVSPDTALIKKKGYCFMSENDRLEIVKALRGVNDALISIDKDGTVAETLKLIKPDIFAKGGDRTPDNMPRNEIQVCQDIGCQLVYGIGERLRSSSTIVNKFANIV